MVVAYHNAQAITASITVDAELEHIVAALRSQMAARPNAADTVDGIASWWLAGAVRESLIEEALHRLVDEGVVVSKRMANGTVIYALKK